MHSATSLVTDKKREWRQVKGQIIARHGTLITCAKAVGCSVQSLRLCIITDILPGIRERLLRDLNTPEDIAA